MGTNCSTSIPTRAKKALTAPSKTSVCPRPGWPSAPPFLLRYFRGYLTDHHRPKAKKKVPRRALPKKVVGIGLILWTCKDKQCLRTNQKHPQGSCWAAQHPQGSTSRQSRCTWLRCKQGIPEMGYQHRETATVHHCVYVCMYVFMWLHIKSTELHARKQYSSAQESVTAIRRGSTTKFLPIKNNMTIISLDHKLAPN